MVCLKYSKKTLTIFWKATCVGAQQWWGWRKQCGFSDSFSHNSQLLQSKGTLVQDFHLPSLMISFFPLPLYPSPQLFAPWRHSQTQCWQLSQAEWVKWTGMGSRWCMRRWWGSWVCSAWRREQCVLFPSLGEGSSCCPSLLNGGLQER